MTNETNGTATVAEEDAARDVRIAGHMLDTARVLLADAQKVVIEAERELAVALDREQSMQHRRAIQDGVDARISEGLRNAKYSIT